jgi:GR25 family glycosyltransferase involved in LPS biosynthesis
MRGYVVSLARRPERLAAFRAHWAESGLQRHIDVEPFDAFDGSRLDLEPLKPRISPDNLAALAENRLRNIVGCALSHLELWRRIGGQDEPMVVFEDDARLAPGVDLAMVASALKRLPRDWDLVWLNDYNYLARASFGYRLRSKLARLLHLPVQQKKVTFGAMPDILTTTEAYVVTPAYSRKLVAAIENDLGAVDRHMQLCNGRAGGRVYQADPPLFGQADRADSDTGGSHQR